MSEPKQEKQSKKSGGGKQQSTKKDGAAKRGRNKNLDGRIHTLRNARRSKATEARRLTALTARLLARGAAGKSGGIKEGGLRHQRLVAHIEALSKGLPVGQAKAETHHARLMKAGNAVGRKLIGLVESGALEIGRESRPMLQYALSLFAKARDRGQAAKLVERYIKAGENRAKAESNGAQPAEHESRDFQVPKTLPRPKRNRKALQAKQRAALIREVKNFTATLTMEEEPAEDENLTPAEKAKAEESKRRNLAVSHVREIMAERAADLTLRFAS